MRNKDLENKTNLLQDEFNKLYEQLQSKRQERNVTDPEDKSEDPFYKAMSEYYDDTNPKHQSPVRRLIKQKNSTLEHKQSFKDEIDRADYSLMYNSPEKSYIIEPHGGEINYNIVNKNPNKFYDQVFNQDITKMTCKRQSSTSPEASPRKKSPLQIKSRITKRPYLKFMAKLKVKIALMIRSKCGIELPDNNILFNAMSTTGVDQEIKLLIS